MLPSYLKTILITLFGRIEDQWVKHRILLVFNSIYSYYVKVKADLASQPNSSTRGMPAHNKKQITPAYPTVHLESTTRTSRSKIAPLQQVSYPQSARQP